MCPYPFVIGIIGILGENASPPFRVTISYGLCRGIIVDCQANLPLFPSVKIVHSLEGLSFAIAPRWTDLVPFVVSVVI